MSTSDCSFDGTLAEFRDFASRFSDLKVHWGWGGSTPSADDPDWRHSVAIYPKPRYDIGPDGEIVGRCIPGARVVVSVDTGNKRWFDRAGQLFREIQKRNRTPASDDGQLEAARKLSKEEIETALQRCRDANEDAMLTNAIRYLRKNPRTRRRYSYEHVCKVANGWSPRRKKT